MNKTKIEYDLWANQQILKQFAKVKNEELLDEITRLFAHLFKAQIIWYNRIYGIKEKVQIWGEYTADECQSLMNDSFAMLEEIANHVDETISYTTTSGKTHTNTGQEIFDHLIIHGQHHRAQILMLLRKAGITPPSTDYIFYLRTL